jgi:hypothetical protein
MSEENKEQGGCGPKGNSCGCGCGCGANGGAKKFLIGLLIGAFIFASGMWYAKSSCSSYAKGGSMKMCPMTGKPMEMK